MRPIDPVSLLACAIAQQEGFFLGHDTPAMQNNPGDLRFSNQLNAVVPPGGGHPIATFKTLTEGVTALYRQLWLQVAEGQTVRQIIAQWAPPNENNTSAYLTNVLTWTALPADKPVLELLLPLERLS
jgi:hypothetical protein